MAAEKVNPLRLSKEAQALVVQYAQQVLAARATFTEIHTKMEAIDRAYARYTLRKGAIGTDGVDTVDAETACNIFERDSIIAPIVVSQVDSLVAYLAEVFLSGSPIFPVVSTPQNRMYAEQLETLLDDHSTLGGYPRQLLMVLRDGAKYNFCACEADWTQVDQFSVVSDYTNTDTGQKLNRDAKFYTKLKRLDLYNTVYDYNVLPGDISSDGDYAGHLEILSKTKMKRLLNKLTDEGEVYNATAATNSLGSNTPGGGTTLNYHVHPEISSYITPRRPNDQVNWTSYLSGEGLRGRSGDISMTNNYEKFVLYARIMASDFGIIGPQQNRPQIWKFIIINNSVLISAKRIISAYDALPILFAQPLEDGLGFQTKSVAEGAIPIQEGASTLFNIRFSAARRAVSDRALYDVNTINPDDINSPAAAPKIPVKLDTLNNKTLENSYKQIPFDLRGTETTIQDAQVLTGFANQLIGLNGPQQGSFQKGNKSVQEWNDTIGGSDNRLRLPALCYEHQFFVPLKSMLVLNLFQFGDNAIVVSQKTGEVIDINMAELRKQVLAFRLADGYTPKSKMAASDVLAQALQLIMQSPILQQAYGASLPNIFAHLMELGGVRGLDQYSPNYVGTQSALQQPAGLTPPVTTPPGAAVQPSAKPTLAPATPALAQGAPVPVTPAA